MDQQNFPVVSIITPSYNNGDFIEETIKSVLGQDYPNIEYIIIDGGSTDNSVELIRKYEKSLACWVSESDNGIGDAFNKGIEKSGGDIVGILNVGDRYTDKAVSLAVRSLTENAYDFAYGDLIYIDEHWCRKFLVKGDANYKEKINYTMPALNHPTVFMKQEVYESLGLFNVTYSLAMDYEFFLRITKAGRKGLYIENVLAEMMLGGRSYENYFDSYKDVYRASIHYGYNPIFAKTRLYVKGLRGFIRVGMEKSGMAGILKILRKLFWNIEYD